MPRRAFFVTCAGAVALFGLFNMLVARMARRTIPRQIASRIDEARTVNFLALGNSLMQAGFDAAAFDAALPDAPAARSINAGLGSSTPIEHLLLARQAFRNHRAVNAIYYGFFDFQLTVLPRTTPSDLIGNRAMLYYFEPAIVPAYCDWSWHDRLSFHAMRLFPALAERGVIWEKVELLRRRMAQVGVPTEQTNRFGAVQDFALLEADDQRAFERNCERQIAGRQALARPLADMIRLARANGTSFSAVEMPMHPSHQQRFYRTSAWMRYRAYLKSLLEREGAEYVEAGDWLQEESMFADHLHASPAGAARFSRKLAASSPARPVFAVKP